MNKNWKAICKIADTHVMWALAMLDMSSPLGRKFVRRFPEYFTKKKQVGPYPLSLMRKLAGEKALRESCDCGGDHVVSHDGVPEGIPVQTFDKFGRHVAGGEFPKLPDEISPDAKQGEIVSWAGKQFVVLENNDSCEELYLAPAELVAADR